MESVCDAWVTLSDETLGYLLPETNTASLGDQRRQNSSSETMRRAEAMWIGGGISARLTRGPPCKVKIRHARHSSGPFFLFWEMSGRRPFRAGGGGGVLGGGGGGVPGIVVARFP